MEPTEPTALLHSAFYRFTPLADPAAAAAELRALATAHGLTGSVLVAAEGVNGTVAGAPGDVRAFEAAFTAPCFWGGALQGLAFKHSACTTPPFGRLKVLVKPEAVALGLPAADAALPAPDEGDPTHLSPAQWRDLLAREDLVLLDNRNHFEYRLGHFRGAVDPGVHNFRDFVAYVQTHAPLWRAQNRPVAMYCTGGIRCDKTAPWMAGLGLQVYQLQGGVLNYFAALPDADQEWQGECFVFDNRVALDTRLQETATTEDQVYDPALPDEAWRLQRARQLARAAATPAADADADDAP
ncbi:MAG: rhodanese-like domain-containing protein [Rubrivivax sp.]|jgi:UPF0176 protein